MYFADTPTGLIQKFEYSQDFRTFVKRDSNMIFNNVGEPDGATVDIENNYWSARVRGNPLSGPAIEPVASSNEKLPFLISSLVRRRAKLIKNTSLDFVPPPVILPS